MRRQDQELRSCLASMIVRYVAVKRAGGRRFDGPAYHLSKLDHFLAAHQASDLDPETFAAWCSTLRDLSPSGRRQRMRIVYRFCEFRRRSEPDAFVPDPGQFPPPQPRPRPHIFSETEIAGLLRSAEELRASHLSPLHKQVARLAVVILYTTGLRRGELVALTLGDYSASERVLLIRETKFYKSRLVPLSGDAAREMEAYLLARLRPGLPYGAESPLLLHGHGGLGGYTGGGLGGLMRRLFRQANIRTSTGRPPRVHDLRFSFAVHVLLRWYRTGGDVQARLPTLATYMGHGSVASTQYYLIFVDALAHEVSARFEQHCSVFLPSDPRPEGRR